MQQIKFGLTGGLRHRQMKMIHETVLRILKETGLGCAHEGVVEAVTAEQGVWFEDGRLKFAPELVEATIERTRAVGRKRKTGGRVRVTAPWTCFNVIDMKTNEVRPSTAADVVEMLKLVASFNDDGPPPVYPWDLDERIQVLWLEKACLETTRGLGGAMVSHDPEAIRWIGRLHQAAGKRYVLSLQFVISPLKLDHLAVDLLLRFRDDPLVAVSPSLSPIPVGGITAPLFASGLLAQSVAESLGGFIVVDRLGLIGPDTGLPIRADMGDMRHLTVGYSLPESVMMQVLVRDLTEYFAGCPMQWIYINTNAKRADALAVVDRMGYMLMLGLAGFRHFYMGAGQLSMDEVFSPAQCIIDMEIGRYVQRILDGLAWGGEPEGIAQAVAEGALEGNFLAHPTTVEALRGLFDSGLFRRDNVGRWRSAGAPTVEQLAVEQAEKAIASYDFELEAGKQAELDRVFGEACRALGVEVERQPIPRR